MPNGEGTAHNQNELEELFTLLDSVAPRRATVRYRNVEEGETLDDSRDSTEEVESGDDLLVWTPDNVDTPITAFQGTTAGDLAAVDCGIVRLGETENGLVIALRCALVVDSAHGSTVRTYRTGSIYLHNDHKPQILYTMGRHLGKPDLFVEVDNSDPERPRPVSVKAGVADDSHQFGDRFRNWLERLVQRHAVVSIQNGTVLFDGALTLRTRDTPSSFLEGLASSAALNGNSIVAVSKQSRLQINNRPLQFWLDDVPDVACYRWLTPALNREGREERTLGQAYAARFSPLGPVFRMDIKQQVGQTCDDAIGRFFASTQMRSGYPDILVRAHAYSYFTPPDVIQLQAAAGARFSLVPRSDINLTSIFAPFGGRFK
jgi:hypothetical protein